MNDWLLCSSTKARLEMLTPTLEAIGEISTTPLSSLLNSIVRRPGKRLRPAMLLLVAGANSPPELAVRSAAALELIHIASLHHDDVIDRAELRRGVSSCNARWGDELATWSGTILSMRAARVFAVGGDTINKLATTEFANLGLGQMREAVDAYNLDLQITDHLLTLELKTASLFRAACQLGATLGDFDKQAMLKLRIFSTCFGIAFQLLDDIDDLRQSAYFDGKAAAQDIREGVYSLAVLMVAQAANKIASRVRTRLAGCLDDDEQIQETLALVRESGAIQASLNVASDFVRRARAPLVDLAPGPMRSSLLSLLSNLEARCHA